MAHALGGSEHLNQEARSVAAVKIRLASILVALRLARSACEMMFALFSTLIMFGSLGCGDLVFKHTGVCFITTLLSV